MSRKIKISTLRFLAPTQFTLGRVIRLPGDSTILLAFLRDNHEQYDTDV